MINSFLQLFTDWLYSVNHLWILGAMASVVGYMLLLFIKLIGIEIYEVYRRYIYRKNEEDFMDRYFKGEKVW